jgi:hypothetical protein
MRTVAHLGNPPEGQRACGEISWYAGVRDCVGTGTPDTRAPWTAAPGKPFSVRDRRSLPTCDSIATRWIGKFWGVR